ncbi:MAG TPA: hypothetical protein VKV26_16565 [Dehalococcoidia bacterium]|nr:hypothetical protein [Dehalococcoidia bacterium]
MTAESQADLLEQADQLYARYVQPLERDHRGEYVAVAPDGRLVLALTLPEAMQKAEEAQLIDTFLFKVGAVAVDTWR